MIIAMLVVLSIALPLGIPLMIWLGDKSDEIAQNLKIGRIMDSMAGLNLCKHCQHETHPSFERRFQFTCPVEGCVCQWQPD